MRVAAVLNSNILSPTRYCTPRNWSEVSLKILLWTILWDTITCWVVLLGIIFLQTRVKGIYYLCTYYSRWSQLLLWMEFRSEFLKNFCRLLLWQYSFCRVYLDTIQDFFCHLVMKPHMHLVEIITFSSYRIIVRPTKILQGDDSNLAHFYKSEYLFLKFVSWSNVDRRHWSSEAILLLR